jgi:hypothetical protein
MERIYSHYLGEEVELPAEREQHIGGRHPDLIPDYRDLMLQTVIDPDAVRRSIRFPDARLFSRWYTDLRGGKHVVVVIVSDPSPPPRNWIITGYMTSSLPSGETEWQRS